MIVVDVYLKGNSTDKALGALGTLMVVWDACVKESQDGVVRPIGAKVAAKSMTGL
jgi:hypothetical protein